MDIQDVISNSGSGNPVGTTGDETSVDEARTQFLTLLLAQLQNQDPLSPMDTDQMTSQMMSLGQLEQLFNLNENVTSLVNITSSNQLAQFSDMVGKEALSQGNVMQIEGANKGSINFKMDKIPHSTTVRIFDQFGNTVNTFNEEVSGVGLHKINYSGLDSNDNPLADGYYTYTIEPLDQDGQLLPSVTYSTGKISSIRIESGVPVFEMGGNDVQVSDIERIF